MDNKVLDFIIQEDGRAKRINPMKSPPVLSEYIKKIGDKFLAQKAFDYDTKLYHEIENTTYELWGLSVHEGLLLYGSSQIREHNFPPGKVVEGYIHLGKLSVTSRP
jgi:hypothetical protein